mmetsp:Transcript_15307/g.36427  ORF Transcript_15307/g.36427 Transcript_15307/m.36427 type:complete len:251 (-) Transcript_15307:636-1388(-)
MVVGHRIQAQREHHREHHRQEEARRREGQSGRRGRAVQGQRDTADREHREAGQHDTRVQQLEQHQAEQAAQRHQAPETRHRVGAFGCRRQAVVVAQELRHPVRQRLLGADVGHDADEEQPHIAPGQQFPVRGPAGGALIVLQLDPGQRQQLVGQDQRDEPDRERPVEGHPDQAAAGRSGPFHQPLEGQRAHEGRETEDQLTQHRIEGEMRLAAGGAHQRVDDDLQQRHAQADHEQAADGREVAGPQRNRQ